MQNVEAEAAKFLQKLIQESKDEPEKLAKKLYVILQHMKESEKENTMPFQVISRAMETVINEHCLDIDAIKPSRLPISGGSQIGDSSRAQSAVCSQAAGVAEESKTGLMQSDLSRTDVLCSAPPPAGPSSAGHDPYQMSVSHRSGKSFDHGSPSSFDTRSANSHSSERHDRGSWEQQGNQKETKKSTTKRRRSDSTSGIESHMDNSQQMEAFSTGADMRRGNLINEAEMPGSFVGATGKYQVGSRVASSPYLAIGGFSGTRSLEPSGQVESEQWKGSKSGNINFPECADRVVQGASANTLNEMTMLRGATPGEAEKFAMPPVPSISSMPFKEHHLKQLRAQCLVFLAFRNGIMPKRMHLEIALGSSAPTEGGTGNGFDGMCGESIDNKGKEQSLSGPNNSLQENMVHPNKIEQVPPGSSVFGSDLENVRFSKETVHRRLPDEKSSLGVMHLVIDERQRNLTPARRIMEDEFQSQEASGLPVVMHGPSQPDSSSLATLGHNNHEDSAENIHLHSGGRQLRHETAAGGHNDAARESLPASVGLVPRKDGSPTQFQLIGDPGFRGHLHDDNHFSTSLKPFQGMHSEQQIMKSANDASTSLVHGSNGKLIRSSNPFPLDKRSSELEEEDLTMADAFLPSPKYSTSEYWIMVQRKRRLVSRQNWVKKQEKANQNIAARFNELKETVSSSEDIYAKTKSVIELKKLQLLELQRRLRSDIMNDFFKVIKPEIDYLKGVKKHRIGRRLKQVEKYEQRMKEERQKRIRERQKDFFSEIEVHKERLEDAFKLKRERWKGFNRYMKEFHKKKERIHREKIDRIQREKINLLKINDVEGYLRMVQDAKSDRVKQLLKETEKYLQKLGSKLQEAKGMARCIEIEMDEARTSSIVDCSDIVTETEDENDQAKHYKESNEKYYMIAHSVKENISEQPTSLRGGKLREYQMNGLRWLVSLYNNNLNGILADEMGLGKTVQVISLMCYLMEAKNERGPFLVVVPSSVLPGWEAEINFWAPGINKIVYSGTPEERRRLFKECIVHQKFNVLLTTYEYLMNKHDRPKLSKVHWHYIIIDEGHRIKNASCKLNANLKHYQSSHRLLLTGTPLQNNLEELWALLNFLLPNIFNSSEDFSQWFNKPFESNGDNSPDEALLSEEENLLIINRLHQVLRPFVLRRLKHKVENELPEKIERLVRCEASAYQKLLMKRVEDNLGSLGGSKVRSVQNSVIELRNICNHPYLSQLHTDEVDALIPKHFLPPIVRLCGKLEMLDRLLPKLIATNHRVLFFSTMTRLLDVMEEYLQWKKYHYLRLDGQTSGNDRGALIDKFNNPDAPFFIFLLSIRAGGVGVNLQAADTVIIFDTDWNPQVDLQAQARAHRIGQKKDVLVLRLETVNTVEEQVRAAAEYKLGVANQSITAGFFDNNTSAEDRREYLESLLRECKKEVAAPVLNDDGLNYLLARSESEIDIFESIDRKRQEEEMEAWKTMLVEQRICGSDNIPPLPPRLVTDEDLKPFYEAMKIYEMPSGEMSNVGIKRKSGNAFDTQQYGRGKRAREVRSYEEQWNEEEFEKLCQADSSETLKSKQVLKDALLSITCGSVGKTEPPYHPQVPLSSEISPLTQEVTPPVKRGRGRPRRVPLVASPSSLSHPLMIGLNSQVRSGSTDAVRGTPDPCPCPSLADIDVGTSQQVAVKIASELQATPLTPSLFADPSTNTLPSVAAQPTGQNSKGKGTETGRRRGRKPYKNSPSIHTAPVVESSADSKPVNSAPLPMTNGLAVQNPQSGELPAKDASPAMPSSDLATQNFSSAQKPLKETLLSTPDLAIGNTESIVRAIKNASPSSPSGGNSQEAISSGNVMYGDSDLCPCPVIENSGGATQQVNVEMVPNFQTTLPLKIDPCTPTCISGTAHPVGPSPKAKGTAETGNRRGKKSNKSSPSLPVGLADERPQASKQPVKDASPSACAGLVVHTLSSSEHIMTENLALAPTNITVTNQESSEQVVKQAAPSGSAGLVFQGSQSTFQPVEQACPTDPSRLAVHNAETSKQVSMRATHLTSSSLGLQEPKSRKRKIILPSSDVPSGPVIPPVLVAAPLASVSQSSVDPSAAMVHGGTPHFGLPSCSGGVASDSHGMPARIYSPKSQSGAEPARRRGRKPALSAHTASSISIVQDPKTYEPLKDAASNVVSSAMFPGSHGTADIGMGSQTVALPIVPLVPVSGLVPGAVAVKDATGSVHHLSVGFAPCFPSTQQTIPVLSATSSSQPDPSMKAKGSKPKSSSGETTPHRRARKTAPVTASGSLSLTGQDSSLRQMEAINNNSIEGKGVEQRLEKNSLETIKAQEVHRVCDPASPVKEPRTNEDISSSEIQQVTVVSLGRSSIGNECVTMKIDEGVKALDLRNDSNTAEPILSSCIANVETSGSPDHKSTIVLALKSASPSVHSINSKIVNRFGSEGSLDFQKEDAEPERFGALETRVSELVGNFTSEIAVICQLDEEMSAPPGFDTPRSHVNALVGTSLGSEDAKFHGKAFLHHEESCLSGKMRLAGATDNLMDPKHFINEDCVPPGFGSKADAMHAVGPNDGRDSSELVDRDSVPPGFEPQTCKGKEKNEAAEVSISSVPIEGDVGQNLMENSYETSLAVPTSMVVEEPVDKCSEQVEDNYGIHECNDPVQAEDLGSGPVVDICKTGTGVSSSSFVENLIPCSEENVCASVSGKNDCSSKIPIYCPHLPDSSIVIEQEKTDNRSSYDSFVGGSELKIIRSPSVAGSDGVVDVYIEASRDSISNSNTVSVCMHEEESHDLDVGKLKGEVTGASCMLTGESEGTLGLNQKDCAVGEIMPVSSSLEIVAEPMQPVLGNPITEVNIEASLKPEVREEGGIISECLPESVLGSHDQPINEEQSTKQQEDCVDASIVIDEGAGTDGGISVHVSCYNGSIQEGSLGEDTAKPQSGIESSTYQLDPILLSTQSGHNQKEASQCAMQQLHSTKMTPIIEVSGAEPEESTNASTTMVPEVCNKEEMITSRCSGNAEFPLCPMVEASTIPADTVASDLASGDDQMVEGECSVLPSLDISTNPTNMDPSFGTSSDGSEVEVECSAQHKLEIPSNLTYMEASLAVPCDSSAMEPDCSMQPILETTADPANVERSHYVSDDMHIVEAKGSSQPLHKIPTDAADLESSHAVSGDDQMVKGENITRPADFILLDVVSGVDQMVKIKCSMQPTEEYSTDPADLEPSQAASDDDQMVAAEPLIRQIQLLFTDPASNEHPEALSVDDKIVGAKFLMQPVSERSTGPSQDVSDDHEMTRAEGSIQQISERSTYPFAIEQPDVFSGDDRIVEAECSMEPISESSILQYQSFSDCDQTVEAECSIQQLSTDSAVLEQLDAISGDDKIVGTECSIQPTSECSTGTVNISASCAVPSDDEMMEAEHSMQQEFSSGIGDSAVGTYENACVDAATFSVHDACKEDSLLSGSLPEDSLLLVLDRNEESQSQSLHYDADGNFNSDCHLQVGCVNPPRDTAQLEADTAAPSPYSGSTDDKANPLLFEGSGDCYVSTTDYPNDDSHRVAGDSSPATSTDGVDAKTRAFHSKGYSDCLNPNTGCLSSANTEADNAFPVTSTEGVFGKANSNVLFEGNADCSSSIADCPKLVAQPEPYGAIPSSTTEEGDPCVIVGITADCSGPVADCPMDRAPPEVDNAPLTISPVGVCDDYQIEGAAECPNSFTVHHKDEILPEADSTMLAVTTEGANDTSLLLENTADCSGSVMDFVEDKVQPEADGTVVDSLEVADSAAYSVIMEGSVVDHPKDESKPEVDDTTIVTSAEVDKDPLLPLDDTATGSESVADLQKDELQPPSCSPAIAVLVEHAVVQADPSHRGSPNCAVSATYPADEAHSEADSAGFAICTEGANDAPPDVSGPVTDLPEDELQDQADSDIFIPLESVVVMADASHSLESSSDSARSEAVGGADAIFTEGANDAPLLLERIANDSGQINDLPMDEVQPHSAGGLQDAAGCIGSDGDYADGAHSC